MENDPASNLRGKGPYQEVTVSTPETTCFQASDLVFVDPPYGLDLWSPVVRALVKHQLLASGALVVVEHPTDAELKLELLDLIDERRYGSVALSFCESE